jgi:CO/xanthine dehydrogenase FAD-binding subunit
VRTSLGSIDLVRPASLEAALVLLRERGPLMPMAGCTDLFVLFNAGTPPARHYLDIWHLDELRGIRAENGVLRLGALSTYTDLIESPVVRDWLPMLVEAARLVGGVQIHNRGTIGGNIANASPAGDTLPVLAVAEAVVVLASVDGERRIPFTGFYTGYRATVRRPDELLVSIEVPRIEGRQWFRKVGTRAAQAVSKVVMAAVRTPSPRIALGSVAPTVVRAWQTERLLARGGSMNEAQRTLLAEIHPIDDVRSTASYRRRISANLLARFWRDTTPPA